MSRQVLQLIMDFLSTIQLKSWEKDVLGFALTVSVILILFFAIKRVAQGDRIEIWKLAIKPDKAFSQLNEQFNKLNADSKQKTQVIKVLHRLSVEITNLLNSETSEEYLISKRSVYLYLLSTIASVLTKEKGNSHRVAVLVDNHDGFLRIHEGVGYSPGGFKNFRVAIDDSAAGSTFKTGEPYFSGNVFSEGNKFKPHPKATKKYYSLMCVAIKCAKMTLGVLSIDGQECNSFTQDDLDYLTYFADALTPLMHIEQFNGQEREGGDDVRIEA